MSSKIIKSSRLTVSEPRTITARVSPTEEITVAAAPDKNTVMKEITEDEVNMPAEVAKQADEILKETEEMVKELLATARTEAEKIISEAREQAEKTIAESKQQAQKIQQEAYEQGTINGYAEGKAKAEREVAALKDEAQRIVEDAYTEKDKIIKSSEGELIRLASAIAQKIIQKELQSDPELIVNIVREGLQKVNDREELTLNVNPENLDNIINEQDNLLISTKGVKKMKVVADPAVTPGGCVIETANGSVDARVERQLEEIEQSLMDVTD